MPTILVVDDEPGLLELFQFALEWRGYRVLLTGNGQAALLTAARQIPDLIVTDWNMPRMNGVELCQRLKSYPALAQIPVVLLSAELLPVQIQPVWAQFRRKPVDLDDLELTVGLLLLARDRLKTARHIPTDRAASRWQPVTSKLIV
ncbi:response regulator [Paraburkholderia phytofirmans]|uniref:Response regulator receiver protein n=1 Tax=Paraburkholderia phytofirmans (strain DSM 17436 / LMG 22146 / PsJN) TaxID=398527 RepID=B2TG99_PARPJ|nr:response regulator [Paraburkholderia phytofirmans]ACD20071.1 response regulator receiver protein [Paraburkholderia phytofirmans PsJN]